MIFRLAFLLTSLVVAAQPTTANNKYKKKKHESAFKKRTFQDPKKKESFCPRGSKLVTVDFSYYLKNGAKVHLNHGDSAENYYGDVFVRDKKGEKLRIYNTFPYKNPKGRDPDLEVDQGNAIIVQDPSTKLTDDNKDGGWIVFDFECKTNVKALTFVDTEQFPHLDFYRDGRSSAIRKRGPQTFDSQYAGKEFGMKDVDRLELKLRKSGGILDITFCSCPTLPPASKDLGIRFNKVSDPDRGFTIKLQAEDYPITGKTATLLKKRSLGDSPVTQDDYELLGEAHAEDYIRRIGGRNSYPNSDPSHAFWDDFREVVDTQLDRRAGVNPNKIFRLPDLWQGMSIGEVAKAVHNEYPGSLQQELLEWLFQEGIKLDYDIVPFRSQVDIISKQFRFADLNTWVFGAVAPINFLIKWHVGRPRPEEVAWLIAKGELTTKDGVPRDIVNKIKSMKLKSPQSFTAYKEGSPTHPAWPAMHSAGSVVSLWLAVICKNLTPKQYCEALRVDYAVSFGRTVAGVHYATDNIAGLNLGQEIMKEKLADHFAEKYGSNRAKVQAKVERWSIDWADFDPEDCSFGKRKSNRL